MSHFFCFVRLWRTRMFWSVLQTLSLSQHEVNLFLDFANGELKIWILSRGRAHAYYTRVLCFLLSHLSQSDGNCSLSSWLPLFTRKRPLFSGKSPLFSVNVPCLLENVLCFLEKVRCFLRNVPCFPMKVPCFVSYVFCLRQVSAVAPKTLELWGVKGAEKRPALEWQSEKKAICIASDWHAVS